MGRVTSRRRVRRVGRAGASERVSTLLVEEPLELHVATWGSPSKPYAETLRLPGHDVEWAHGRLLADGVIRAKDDVAQVRYCSGTDSQGRNTYNVLEVVLAEGVSAVNDDAPVAEPGACGIDGATHVAEVSRRRHAVRAAAGGSAVGGGAFDRCETDAPEPWSVDDVGALPGLVQGKRPVRRKTGAGEAAALVARDGTVFAVREDADVLNAVDKVCGWALTEGAESLQAAGLAPDGPFGSAALVLTAPATYAALVRAVSLGVGLVCAPGATSALAAELAEASGLTLVGGAGTDTLVVYSGVLPAP